MEKFHKRNDDRDEDKAKRIICDVASDRSWEDVSRVECRNRDMVLSCELEISGLLWRPRLGKKTSFHPIQYPRASVILSHFPVLNVEDRSLKLERPEALDLIGLNYYGPWPFLQRTPSSCTTVLAY
jgi:hypothetical protein